MDSAGTAGPARSAGPGGTAGPGGAAAAARDRLRAANVRTALVLLSVVLVFFLGIVLRYWLG